MNITDITLSQELNPVQNNWQFTEVWIDPMLTPPYLLLFLANATGKCQIYDPVKGFWDRGKIAIAQKPGFSKKPGF
ncbi:MAG: hypothetical protein AUK43_10625 [Oscillatoriales cyanobacterium CG2_30_40_61]|nr:MAG: hypothetical protein AUK43_10625 [Oscillatoriales cyanobacterium CG2_30_40_61]